MTAPIYALPLLRQLSSALAAQLEAATAAAVRLDEQVGQAGVIGEGYRSRVDFQEGGAVRALEGELVPLEDLVLSDAGAPVRLPTIALSRASVVLRVRRSAAAKPSAWAWSDRPVRLPAAPGRARSDAAPVQRP
jgi:hypothetical protein